VNIFSYYLYFPILPEIKQGFIIINRGYRVHWYCMFRKFTRNVNVITMST